MTVQQQNTEAKEAAMFTEAQPILLGLFTRKAMLMWINFMHLLRRQFSASLTNLFPGSENPRRHNLFSPKCHLIFLHGDGR